ncbi:MAG: TonB-dependent receptor, partial [Comamonadaceae bacterium]
NAALFQARTTGEIVVLSNTGGRSTFQNAGQTRRRGLEAALDGRWGGGWSLLAAATWLDATYASDFLTCAGAPCPTPTTTVPAGNRIPGIPRSTAFVELGWAHKPWGLETALEWRRVSRIATDDRNTEAAPAAAVWNLRVALTQPVGRWTLREFVRIDNLADRRYVGSVIVNEGNQRFFEPAPGRNWLVGVSAAYTF